MLNLQPKIYVESSKAQQKKKSSALADDESMEFSSGVPLLSVCFVVHISSWVVMANRKVSSILVCGDVARIDTRCGFNLGTDA